MASGTRGILAIGDPQGTVYRASPAGPAWSQLVGLNTDATFVKPLERRGIRTPGDFN
jgi:hypothetical protein